MARNGQQAGDVSATFRTKGSFVLSRGTILVVAGEILDGTVRAGMVLVRDQSTADDRAIRIDRVEMVDHGGGEADVALLFQVRKDQELGWLQKGLLETQILKFQ